MTTPHQAIPDSTQVHVDRLLGAFVGEYQLLERIAEGRLGTIYKAEQKSNARPITFQVLRSEVVGNDEEARAANAIAFPGIVSVLGFGELPDGRRYRAMEWLEGESLDTRLQRTGKISALETITLLDQVAKILEASHAWAIPHGSLIPSSVWVVGDSVRLIDFGLAKQKASIEGDLQSLGSLGFGLMMGKELEGAPPPLSDAIPEPLDRLFRELIEKRLNDMTQARKELALLEGFDAPIVQAKKSRAPIFIAVALIVIGGAGFFAFPQLQNEPEPVPETTDELLDDDAELELEEAVPEQPNEPNAPPRPRPTNTRTSPRPVPSAQTLTEQIAQLEARFHKQVKPGDDIDQALFVLNKQRLRLTGNPSVEDRKEVARQLAGWRRSYLKKK